MTVAVDQFGTVRCPICSNTIEWSYKVERWIPNGTDRIVTAIKSTPKAITPIAAENGKIQFHISCERCGFAIKTNPMPLIAVGRERSIDI